MIKLDSVRSKLIAGTISFGEAVNKYSEDEGSKFNGGQIQSRDGSNFVTIDQMDKNMVLALKEMKLGEYSQPLAFTDDRGRKAVRIINLKSRTEPHRENLKEDYDRVAKRALEEKKSSALEKWFKDHIPTYFISIDKQYTACKSLEEWRKSAEHAEKARQ